MSAASCVSIIVVTWNSEGTLAACLDSALAQEWPRVETLVVDNGSRDGTREMLTSRAGITTYLLNENTGFAHACNFGIARSTGDYVVLLNADAELAPDYLPRIIPELESRPRAGSAMGKILRSRTGNPVIDSTGIVLNRLSFSPCDRGENEADEGQYAAMEEVFGPTGAAAVYKRAALDDVRLSLPSRNEWLDEDFFAYYEDVDLAWRLQLRGWSSLYVPQAAAWHARRGPQGQPGPIAARAYFNRYFCYVKNETRAGFRKYGFRRVLRETARAAWHAFRSPRILAAAPRALALLPKMIRKRQIIQQRVDSSVR